MSGIYHMNGVPSAYSTIAEDVQKGRDAKVSHLLAQVIQLFENKVLSYSRLLLHKAAMILNLFAHFRKRCLSMAGVK